MSHNNSTTLKSYESGVQAYTEGTANQVSGSMKAWIDALLALLPSQARLIEIGSAFGRDADYIESQGFTVERTDAAEGFVALLKSKGHLARRFNILTDDFTSPYDLVFANAVFLHLTREELKAVLGKIHASLKPQGILAFSVKQGEGEEWTTTKVGHPRYFCYWQEEPIKALLEAMAFKEVTISKDEKWLKIISRKAG